MERDTLLIGIFTAILLIMQLSEIYIETELIPAGQDLGKLQNKITAIKKENMLLSQQLYTDTSYMTIASEAAALGFVPEKNTIWLSK